jgi:hypothetical protein
MKTPFLELKNFPRTMSLGEYCKQIMAHSATCEMVKSSDPESYLEVLYGPTLADLSGCL